MRASSSRATSRKLWLTSAVGAFAALALAMAVPAMSQETSGTDEAFQLTTVYGLTNTGIGNPLTSAGTPNKSFFSFDISWVDPVLLSLIHISEPTRLGMISYA